MAALVGMHVHAIFDWKDKEPGQILKKKSFAVL
jgi:hypothetical protein